MGGEGGFPPEEGRSPSLGAPSEPGGGVPGGEGGDIPSDEELDALIDEVLGGGGKAGAGKHRLAGRVAKALKGKKGKAFAIEEAVGEEKPDDERPDEMSALLEQLETDHPDWDDDALVKAAVAELGGGSEDGTEQEIDGDGNEAALEDEDLDALLDEVLGAAGSGKEDKAAVKSEEEVLPVDGAKAEGDEDPDAVAVEDEGLEVGIVDEAELDRLITAALAKRSEQDTSGQGAGTPGLPELVDAVVAEHPDWGAEQVKAEVLNRVKVAEGEGEPIA